MDRVRGSVALAGAMSLALCTWQGSAAAAGFATQQFGGEHGSVVDTNPTSLYYNPGAIGFSGNTNIGLYGSLALHSVTWKHDKAVDDLPDPPDAQGANTGKAQLLNVFGGASLAGTTHIGNLVIGGGFFAPFFGLAHWGQNDSFSDGAKYPLAKAGGVQRWFAIDGKIEVLYFSVGAAYKLGPLSLGATGNFISSTVSQYQAKSVSGVPDTHTNQEGRSYFDVQGYSGSFGAGAMLEIVPQQVWLGASYQSEPGMGPQSIDGDTFVTLPGQKTAHIPVTLHQELPDIWRAGLRVHPKSIPWEFRAFGDFTRWSVMKTQCVAENGASCAVAADGTISGSGVLLANVRRNWNDTWGVRLGASYWVKPQIELFVGAGYEIAAVPDSTLAPDLPDANNVLGAIGGRFALTEALYIMASYTHIQYMNRDNTGKSTLATDASGNAVGVPTAEGNGGGQYTQWAGVFTGNLEAMF